MRCEVVTLGDKRKKTYEEKKSEVIAKSTGRKPKARSNEAVLNQQDLADVLCVSLRTLKKWKGEGCLPKPFLDTGRGGVVRWWWADIKQYFNFPEDEV